MIAPMFAAHTSSSILLPERFRARRDAIAELCIRNARIC
jgi:hypothetical protein